MSNATMSINVTLPELKRSQETRPKWSDINLIIEDDQVDICNTGKDNDSGLKDTLLQEQLKSFALKSQSEGVKPLIYNEKGNVVERSDKPEYTNENISVLKSAFYIDGNTDLDKIQRTLEKFGENLPSEDKEEIIKAMDMQCKTLDTAAPSEVKTDDTSQNSLVKENSTAVIGTFNIEWLGKKERSEEAYQEIAQVIKDGGAHILGIQEITNERGLKKVLNYLPDYGYILGKTGGGQKVGVIFDKTRVKYDINSVDQIDDAQISGSLRAPLLVDMKIDNNFDFAFAVVHLKAMMDSDAVETRKEQSKGLNKWIKNHLKNSEDKDVIIVGDFNDFVGSQSLDPLFNNKNLLFLTHKVPADFYTNIPWKGTIDHAIVTNVDKGAGEKVVEGSVHTIDESKYPEYLANVSDHRPVFFTVRTNTDHQ